MSNAMTTRKDTWSSNIGVILAVAGCAVGLGNFLRFPGQAAQFGGGAFMIAYVISFIILGIPIGWMEWIMGRYGGKRGFFSYPGILNLVWNNRIAKYIGVCGVVLLIVLYTYYSYVEAWCLGYAINFLKGNLHFESIQEASNFWENFIGYYEDGSGFVFSFDKIGPFLLIVLVLNLTIVYRGISKGIELFATYAVPTLIIIGIIVLIKVLTLGTPNSETPEKNINNGLGFMWNPTKHYIKEFNSLKNTWSKETEIIGKKTIQEAELLAAGSPTQYHVRAVTVFEQLKNPRLWLAAASQIFFSLAVGFGVVMVYASYTKPDDDLILSNLSAASTNEFCEVCLGGLITIPAAYAFFGAAGIVGQGTFDLGFKVLPMVFSAMQSISLFGVTIPIGNFFGFLFFAFLFIASISGVLAQLQCGIAFFEEALNINRKLAVALIGMIAALGFIFVSWFSEDSKAMSTLDFWIGQFLIFTITTINVIVYGWVFGMDKAYEEAHQGAAIRMPNCFKFITKYVCPLFLLTIFFLWIFMSALGMGGQGIDSHILDLIGTKDKPPSIIAWLSIGMVVILTIFLSLIASRVPRYLNCHRKNN